MVKCCSIWIKYDTIEKRYEGTGIQGLEVSYGIFKTIKFTFNYG